MKFCKNKNSCCFYAGLCEYTKEKFNKHHWIYNLTIEVLDCFQFYTDTHYTLKPTYKTRFYHHAHRQDNTSMKNYVSTNYRSLTHNNAFISVLS